LSGSHDRSVRLWEAASGRLLRRLTAENPGPVWAAAFSPDGRMVASGSGDRLVRVWDARTGAKLFDSSGVPGGHQDGVTALAFSPDGRRLLSAGGEPAEGEDHARDYALRLWALPRDLPSEGATLSVARELRAWLGPALPTVLLPPAGARAGPGTTVPVAPLAASADGQVLLSAGADHPVRVWD